VSILAERHYNQTGNVSASDRDSLAWARRSFETGLIVLLATIVEDDRGGSLVALNRWHHQRFGGGRRTRRIEIVALARKLLIASWRHLETGAMSEGAVMKIARNVSRRMRPELARVPRLETEVRGSGLSTPSRLESQFQVVCCLGWD